MGPIEKELASVWQQLGSTISIAKAAHSRLDKHESQTRQDLKEIQSSMALILNKIQDLKLEMAKDKAFKAGVLFVGSLLGAAVGALAPIVIPMIFR